ncbi:3-phosphoshikimate 1-carboxyvinyltransferase [Flavobacterium amnicola]|uniref:3-phosphoshikimate 1-carboxyvinyltransferase n=1 Tax=Flavobacterium amnicola TaxID=2506422 RepID=A0A4Q1K6Y4_9FLAO|nr:3-phosphoshikimate 1-carboxyvinyltransferase [Flavobacterium amnicola]RXR21362.1 3-phosphoshikimate 1-carboxyvinyltransferase [Flavobacterium amnicola]
MNLLLQKISISSPPSVIKIAGSKSETNRLLLLQALYPELKIENISNSDDSEVMQKALQSNKKECHTDLVDVHHAGTAMRFLAAFFAIQEGKEVILTGSSRMKERPIQILVDALRQLGANIEYVENEGFPPLRISGKKITHNNVSLAANVSSQYISALLLMAPKLENGLELTLEGEITSVPYIKMTLALLHEIGVKTSFKNNIISVSPQLITYNSQLITVESDWSSASYWYSIIALSAIGTKITLSSYKENSLQGDAALVEMYKNFGVETAFNGNESISISKKNNNHPSSIIQQLNDSPDLAQTIAVTCFGLGMGCQLSGLQTLKIKETDRLQALKNELEKLGATVMITDDSLQLEPSSFIRENVTIETYQDHRMAMAFAPLALKTNIIIEEAEVVSKSYPNFWTDLKAMGFHISEI